VYESADKERHTSNITEEHKILPLRARSMVRKIKCPHLGKNQQKVLEILDKYQELTARDIAEILWARDIHYKTAEYSSVHRSLRTLRERGLVEQVGGKIKWRKNKKA